MIFVNKKKEIISTIYTFLVDRIGFRVTIDRIHRFDENYTFFFLLIKKRRDRLGTATAAVKWRRVTTSVRIEF